MSYASDEEDYNELEEDEEVCPRCDGEGCPRCEGEGADLSVDEFD